MHNDLVSIIIPTYNRSGYLREALESVLGQSYETLEILVLDNHSSDDTPDVVKGYSDQRIKYLRHLCNIGALANWLYGVYWSRGRYLSILGDDDKYKQDFISRRVEALNSSGALAAFSGYELSDASGKIIGRFGEELPGPLVVSGAEFLSAIYKGFCFLGTGMYVAATVKRLFNRALTAGKAGDVALSLLMALEPESRGVRLPGYDYIYRRHPAQDSDTADPNNLITMISDCIRFSAELIEYGYVTVHRKLVERNLAFCHNMLGRLHWDNGNIQMSTQHFLREISLSPFNALSCARLIRCLCARFVTGLRPRSNVHPAQGDKHF